MSLLRGLDVYLPSLMYPLEFGLLFICDGSLDLGLDCLKDWGGLAFGVVGWLLSLLTLLSLLADLLLLGFLL